MSAKPGSKKKAGEALEALAMLDKVDMAFLTIDKGFRVTYANRMAAEFFGRQGASLVRVCLHDLLEACLPHTGVFDRWYDRISTSGKAGELEVPVHNFRWALFRLYPQESGMTMMIEDITHRRIREEPQRAALLTFNSLSEAVFLLYENGAIYYANDAAFSATGYTLEDLKMLRASEVIPDLDPELLMHNIGHAPGSARFESVMWPKEGDAVLVEVCVTAQKLFRKTNYIVSIRDITERKRAEVVLRESERAHAFQSAVLESVRDPVWATDPDFRIVYWNDAAAATFGWTADEVRGRHTDELFRGPVPGSTRDDAVAQLLQTGDFRGEVVCHCKDGRQIFAEASSRVVRGPDGEAVRIVNTARDITERKRHERRQDFLLKLNDVLRPLSDPVVIQAAVTTFLREYFDVARSYYMEVDDEHDAAYCSAESARGDVPSVTGVYDLKVFAETIAVLRDGVPFVVNDWHDRPFKLGDGGEENLSRRQIRSQIAVPLLKHGRLVSTLSVNDTRPRKWTEQDIELVVETAERTWAAVERAHAEEALRESEARIKVSEAVEVERQRLYEVLEGLPATVNLITPDYHIPYGNRAFREKFGELDGRHCYEYCFGKTGPCEFCEAFTVFKTGKPYHFELNSPDGSVLDVYDYPFNDVDGSPLILEMCIDITERKRIEKTLRLSEEKYRSLFENMAGGFQILEPIFDNSGKPIDFRYIEINKASAEIAGMKREEIEGKTSKELWGVVEDYWVEMLGRVLQTGEPADTVDYSGEFDVYHDVHAWKIDERRVAILFTDTTERRRAEEALRNERARLQAIIDTIPIGFFIAEASGKVSVTNEEAKRIWAGVIPLERIDDYVDYIGFWPGTGERLRAEDWPAAQALLYGRTTLGVEVDIQRFDGTRGTILFSGAPVKGNDGTTIGAVVAILDITELKRSEEKLIESAELYRTLFNNSNDGFVLVEPIFDEMGNSDDYRMLEVNEAWERQTGLRTADLLGKRIREALPAIEHVWPSTFAEVVRTGSDSHFESYNADSGRWYDLHAFPYRTGQVGVLFRDITERKQGEEALLESKVCLAAELAGMSRLQAI
ncbi:MAG TPA: PAS domain S-box protein, partial [Methanocella sp.]|nr:PAS domain S-box protein [Methanocella sp.]